MTTINRNGKNYQITLRTYLDNSQVPINNYWYAESVVIFRKKDNKFMQVVDVSATNTATVLTYNNPSCASITNQNFYQALLSADVFLDPLLYNDPQGYYILYDRYARYKLLTNITNPGSSSFAILLEFPAVNLIKNASPKFSSPISEVLCLNQAFKTTTFNATDDDNDELRYSLVEPLVGYTSLATNALLDITPRNFRPSVSWTQGCSKDKQITGNPSLNINPTTGEISVIPNQTGFFVFSILCEEFRNGVKIGSNQREFALKVISCNTLTKPIIEVNGNPTTNLINPCPTTTTIIEVKDNNMINFQWYKNNQKIIGAIKNTLSVSEDGEYAVEITAKNNCSISISSEKTKIAFQNCTNSIEKLFIPNAFTPNKDGQNDVWEIKNMDKYPEAEVFIYNQWGEEIFYSKGYSVAWNGIFNDSKVNNGTYIYKIITGGVNSLILVGSLLVLY